MKKRLFLLSVPFLFLVLGCSSNVQSGLVTKEADFLNVAGFDGLAIVSTSVKNITGSSNLAGTTKDSSSSGAASSEASASHSASLYKNDNYVISNGGDNYIGLSGTYSGLTQYILINVTKKTGFVTNDGTLLNDARNLTKQLLRKDYSDLSAAYDSLKGYVGKKASDFENMTSLYLGYSYAGTTAGYTFRSETRVTTNKEVVASGSPSKIETTDTVVKTAIFMTLDQYDGKWAFTNCSKRVETLTTITIGQNVDAARQYAINEVSVGVASEYPPLSVSLADYSVYLHDEGIQDVVLTNGIPLSGK